MNHSDKNPIVGGSPARLRAEAAKQAEAQGWERAMPRSLPRSALPAAASKLAPPRNRPVLATAWARAWRVAARSPTATRDLLPTYAPASATPKPTMMMPPFSTLDNAMTRSCELGPRRRRCRAGRSGPPG